MIEFHQSNSIRKNLKDAWFAQKTQQKTKIEFVMIAKKKVMLLATQ